MIYKERYNLWRSNYKKYNNLYNGVIKYHNKNKLWKTSCSMQDKYKNWKRYYPIFIKAKNELKRILNTEIFVKNNNIDLEDAKLFFSKCVVYYMNTITLHV